MEINALQFNDPYSFFNGPNYLFESEFARRDSSIKCNSDFLRIPQVEWALFYRSLPFIYQRCCTYELNPRNKKIQQEKRKITWKPKT